MKKLDDKKIKGISIELDHSTKLNELDDTINEFKEIFEPIINTMRISPWDMKIYMFLSGQPRKVLIGICK